MKRTAVITFLLGGAALTSTAHASSLTPYWHFSGVLHPVAAHFPVALLMVAALLELLRLATRGRVLGDAGYACLLVGAAGAVVTAVLGWANADAAGEFNGSLEQVVFMHRWLGVAVAAVAMVVSVIATVARRRPQSSAAVRWSSRAGLLLCAALVALTGSYGGKLTHGVDYYADAYDDMMAQLATTDQPNLRPAASVPPRLAENAQLTAPTLSAVIDSPPLDTPSPEGTSNTTAATEIAEPPADAAGAADVSLPSENPAEVSEAANDATPASRLITAEPPESPEASAPPAARAIDYASQIRPIFQDNCIKCHGDTKQKGGYRLDQAEYAFAAGDSGEVPIIPGKSEASLLVKVVEGKGEYKDEMMPPKGALLSAEQVVLIRTWIDQGAHWRDQATTPRKPG